MLTTLLSASVFVAVPLTGRLALGRLGTPIPIVARPALWVAVGLAIWSVPLLLSLTVPIEASAQPEKLRVVIGDTGPAGTTLEIALNGVNLFVGDLPPGGWTGDLTIPLTLDVSPGTVAHLEIRSGTFDGETGPGYEGAFGVRVDSVVFAREED